MSASDTHPVTDSAAHGGWLSRFVRRSKRVLGTDDALAEAKADAEYWRNRALSAELTIRRMVSSVREASEKHPH